MTHIIESFGGMMEIFSYFHTMQVLKFQAISWWFYRTAVSRAQRRLVLKD